MGACIRKRVVYDMSCKHFQFFVNMEALNRASIRVSVEIPFFCKSKCI